MNKALKKKWTDALTSGQYRRATGQLKKHSGYCCLGVLCKITDTEFSHEDSSLPEELGRQVGLTYEQQWALAALNDGDLNNEHMKVLGIEEPPKGYRGMRGAGFQVVAEIIRKL